MAKRYRFRFKHLDVYQAAVQHFAWTVSVVGRLPRGPFVLPNQMVGAALSIVGNLGEANGRGKRPGEVEQHYRYAQGSTFECASYLDALHALGTITDEEYNAQEDHLSRIAAMLTRLMQTEHRKRAPAAAGTEKLARSAASKSEASKSPRSGRRPSSPERTPR